MVIWITGRKGSGKTSIAKSLLRLIPNAILIDGDKIRNNTNNRDFTDKGRRDHILAMAETAANRESRGMVPIVACVSPCKKWRMEARAIFKESILIYRPGGTLWEGTTYEEPDAEEMSL